MIDIECYCWSTVLAADTPMINAGMVFCDRHYGGINYPKVQCGAEKRAESGVAGVLNGFSEWLHPMLLETFWRPRRQATV